MGYLDTGLFIGSMSTIVCLILTLKRRWFKDNILEDLYLWWDGEKHDGGDLIQGLFVLFLASALVPLVIALAWAPLLPIGFIFFILLKIRKRNIDKKKGRHTRFFNRD